MTRLLVVRAHPLDAGTSRTMRLTDEFVAAYRAAHPEDSVTDLHLYEVAIPEIDLDLLNGWHSLRSGTPFVHLDQVEQVKITLFNHYTEQFMESDKVVIANPLWNLQVPTRLKAWIDTISVAGVTFKYNASGEGVGLVRGKRALHIQTAGGVFNGQDPASAYVSTLFAFLGVDDFHEVHAEGMDHDPANADEIMATASRRVAELAREF
ncbi:FMN-dependent NADH-azoreductase [Actinomyces provencensis]|uniref:FMN-dependent NADH-azoreductase n=1 Tax=Actinomyces provencensis TaxID=1720198 RepID=UPI00096A6FBD|nr:NAD(P)H-dependent oxidoreductase [Actinomyces provencensis]